MAKKEHYIIDIKDYEDDNLRKIKYQVYEDLDSRQDAYVEMMERRLINADFYFGRQLTEEEQAKIEQQGRKPYVFNQIKPKVDHLLGAETQTRMDTMVKGRERGDDATAQVLNALVKYIEQVNDLPDKQTACFFENVLCGYTVAQVRWQQESLLYGYPKIEKLPLNEIRWDGMARESDFSDARWMSRVMQVSRVTAAENYPDFYDLIYAVGNSILPEYGYYDGKFSNIKSSTQVLNQHLTFRGIENKNREVIDVIEHYERKQRPYFNVIDAVSGIVKTFDERTNAQAYYKGLVDAYQQQGELLIDPMTGSRKVMIDIVNKTVIIQTVIIGDICVYSQETGLADFPFVIATGYFDEGYAIGFVDNLILPQVYYNDTMSTIDYMLGTQAKNPMLMIKHMFPKNTDPDHIKEQWSSMSPVIQALSPNALIPIKQPGIPSELYQNVQMAEQYMLNSSGGQNAFGLQSSASESGKAIEARAQAGGTGRLKLFDSMKKWRKNIALRVIWWIKNYMTNEQILRILGTIDTPFVEIDPGVLNNLAEINFDVVIDETAVQSAVREQQFTQIQQMFVQSGISPEIAIPILIEYSMLPEMNKQKILTRLENHQTYMQEQMQSQQEQKLQQQVHAALQKRQLADNLLAQGQYQTSKEVEKAITQQQKLQEQEAVNSIEQLGPQELNDLILGQQTPPQAEQVQQ